MDRDKVEERPAAPGARRHTTNTTRQAEISHTALDDFLLKELENRDKSHKTLLARIDAFEHGRISDRKVIIDTMTNLLQKFVAKHTKEIQDLSTQYADNQETLLASVKRLGRQLVRHTDKLAEDIKDHVDYRTRHTTSKRASKDSLYTGGDIVDLTVVRSTNEVRGRTQRFTTRGVVTGSLIAGEESTRGEDLIVDGDEFQDNQLPEDDHMDDIYTASPKTTRAKKRSYRVSESSDLEEIPTSTSFKIRKTDHNASARTSATIPQTPAVTPVKAKRKEVESADHRSHQPRTPKRAKVVEAPAAAAAGTEDYALATQDQLNHRGIPTVSKFVLRDLELYTATTYLNIFTGEHIDMDDPRPVSKGILKKGSDSHAHFAHIFKLMIAVGKVLFIFNSAPELSDFYQIVPRTVVAKILSDDDAIIQQFERVLSKYRSSLRSTIFSKSMDRCVEDIKKDGKWPRSDDDEPTRKKKLRKCFTTRRVALLLSNIDGGADLGQLMDEGYDGNDVMRLYLQNWFVVALEMMWQHEAYQRDFDPSTASATILGHQYIGKDAIKFRRKKAVDQLDAAIKEGWEALGLGTVSVQDMPVKRIGFGQQSRMTSTLDDLDNGKTQRCSNKFVALEEDDWSQAAAKQRGSRREKLTLSGTEED